MNQEQIDVINNFDRMKKSKLEDNDIKGDWIEPVTNEFLLKKLITHVNKLENNLTNNHLKYVILNNALDIANYAMMISDSRRF